MIETVVALDSRQIEARRELTRARMELGQTYLAMARERGADAPVAAERDLETAARNFARGLEETEELVRGGLDRSLTYFQQLEGLADECRAELESLPGRPE